MGATEDRNKYRRKENGWDALYMSSVLFSHSGNDLVIVTLQGEEEALPYETDKL